MLCPGSSAASTRPVQAIVRIFRQASTPPRAAAFFSMICATLSSRAGATAAAGAGAVASAAASAAEDAGYGGDADARQHHSTINPSAWKVPITTFTRSPGLIKSPLLENTIQYS